MDRRLQLLYCVQRYGEEVGGGAEAACRMFAEQMVGRGHHVEVLTSCARDYTTWANDFPAGTSELNGVVLHRLPVRLERTAEQFGPLSERVLGGSAAVAVEYDWVRAQGPDLAGLEEWLADNAGRFDVSVFYTYLYSPSAFGLPEAARRTATLLHPAAHDEPMISLRAFDDEFVASDGVAVHTAEEATTVLGRVRHPLVQEIGLGVEVNPPDALAERFRSEYGLGAAPVLLYVGRIEPAKGTDELVRYFLQSKERLEHEVKLVMVGPLVEPPDDHPDIITTGFVDEQTRLDAYAASDWFVLPSYFESFSIALCDAWVARRPALVNANCAVLAGQATRSAAGLGYRNYPEFEQALARLTTDPGLCRAMGDSGRRYVVSEYDWSVVLDRYEGLIAATIGRRRERLDRALSRFSPGSTDD